MSSSSARLEFEAPAQVLHWRDDLLLELIDAHPERARDVFHATRQGRIDVSGDSRQRLGQLFRPPLQRLTDLRRFGAHALRDLATAVSERLGGFEGAADEGFGQRPAALGESVFDPRQKAFERRRDFAKFCPGAFLDGLQTTVEQRGRLFVSLAELFIDRAAAVDESFLNGDQLGAEIGRESRGPIANLLDDFATAPVDCAFEARKPVAERSLDAARMRRQGEIDRIVMRGGSDLKLLQPLRGLRRQLLPVIDEALVEVIAPGLHHIVDRIEMSGDASVELVGMGPQAVDDAMPALADETIQRLEIFAHPLGLLRHGLHEADAAVVDDVVKGCDPLAQGVMHAARSVRRCGRCVDSKRR